MDFSSFSSSLLRKEVEGKGVLKLRKYLEEKDSLLFNISLVGEKRGIRGLPLFLAHQKERGGDFVALLAVLGARREKEGRGKKGPGRKRTKVSS